MKHHTRCFVLGILIVGTMASTITAQPGRFDLEKISVADEARFFTAPGFERAGEWAQPPKNAGRLEVTIRDAGTGQATPCRVFVLGADGNYYQPADNPLSEYGLSEQWPDGWGNRPGKGPVRFLGRFFYTTGKFQVAVPPGTVRLGVCKGWEYQPVEMECQAITNQSTPVVIPLRRAFDATSWGWYSGDPHLHFPRDRAERDAVWFDLLEAEDIRYGVALCYNLDTAHYSGRMDRQESPQRSLGAASIASRGKYHLMSAQEYRSGKFGHLLLYARPDMVLAEQNLNPDLGPVFGGLCQQTINGGGIAIHAHGGYNLEILADYALRASNGVELLQFGIYRGIGLESWYRILNIGYRYPATGASDFPACRYLGDCRTYVHSKTSPDFSQWLQGMAAGQSFVSTGPILLLEVDDQLPGSQLPRTSRDRQDPLIIRLRARCAVAPVSHLQLVVNGDVVAQRTMTESDGISDWIELRHQLPLRESAWIAGRAFSRTPTGAPNAEAHTNPVYVYFDRKAPYRAADLAILRADLDKQIDGWSSQTGPSRDAVVGYFQKARAQLDAVANAGGMSDQLEPLNRSAASPDDSRRQVND